MKFPKQKFIQFCNRLIIDSKERGLVPLHLNGAQKYLIDQICEGLSHDIHKFVVLKGRQFGCSTVMLALDLFWQFYFPGMQGAVICDKEKTRDQFKSTLEGYLLGLPHEWKIPVRQHNRNQFVLQNRSRVAYMVAGGRQSGALARGAGLNFLHGTECSSWSDDEGLASLNASLAEKHPNRLYVFESPLALETPVATPAGWSTIGEIKAGDIVYDDAGQETEVIGTSPVFTGRRCFEIHFSTGDKIVSDEAHKWRVERMGSSVSRWKTMEVTTAQLDPERDRIWIGAPIIGRECELPIDPYFLGVWLGDGHNEAVRITCGDQDMEAMRENLKARGVKPGPVTHFKGRPGGVFGIRGLMPLFKEQNLINNKHIPKAYLRADVEMRKELLRGLMDTDGTIAKGLSSCTFTNGCRALVDDFCELLSSLGIRYSVLWMNPGEKVFGNGKSYLCQPYAMVHFAAPIDFEVFALPRKAEIQKLANTRKRRARRYGRASIVSIREVQSVPVKCISVEAESHLFRVGRTMLTTHNTARGFNMFYDMWTDATRARTTKAIFIGWWLKEDYALDKDSEIFQVYWDGRIAQDERKWVKEVKSLYGYDIKPEQLAWWRWKLNEEIHDEKLMMQEFPPTEEYAFILSGEQFFSTTTLLAIKKEIDASPAPATFSYEIGPEFQNTTLHASRDGELTVWEEPVDGAYYTIGADPAYGASETSDSFVIQVLRCYADGCEQVAEYASRQGTMYGFAWILAHLAGAYRNVHIVLEITGPGQGVWQELCTLPAKLSTLDKKDAPVGQLLNIFGNISHYIYRRPDSLGGGGGFWHWQTTATNKQWVMHGLRDTVERKMLKVRSIEWVEEARYITQEGSHIAGAGRSKDDRIMAMALAVEGWIRAIEPLLRAQGRTRKMAADTPPITVGGQLVERYLENIMTGKRPN